MSKNMLIDAAHLEEVRVAIVDGSKLDKFDYASPSKIQIKGNIYLGKIVRVEPSLQAAFVDFGQDKHGFLGFSEIHHGYFQIPVGDRDELENCIQEAMAAAHVEGEEENDDDMDSREISRVRYQFYRRYKIQEVIKKNQIVLVQVTKEARGIKGAALTTYISLAGRYCVFMPNMSKGSGVSRKIFNPKDRLKLKKIVSELNTESGSAVIRTAGVGHTRLEIKKDFEYLKNLWDEIRKTTLQSTAPSLIYEEANIIKRAIRDLYSRDIESIFVEGEAGYKFTKDLVRKFMPSHAKKVKFYNDEKLLLFNKFNIDEQINQIYSTRADLPSGGYLVINTTEALVSIDVNSGKATRARDVSGTAIKTNLEAAVEIARQCRLRDLAGLIVVDFIDMEDKRSNTQVERCLREALKEDRARIQIGNISKFGLLEFSRQRLRSSFADANMTICPCCKGVGAVWSNESIALQILRKIEATCMTLDISEVTVTVSTAVASYLLNNKKDFISSIEKRGVKIKFEIDTTIPASDFKISHNMKSIEDEKKLERDSCKRKNGSKQNQRRFTHSSAESELSDATEETNEVEEQRYHNNSDYATSYNGNTTRMSSKAPTYTTKQRTWKRRIYNKIDSVNSGTSSYEGVFNIPQKKIKKEQPTNGRKWQEDENNLNDSENKTDVSININEKERNKLLNETNMENHTAASQPKLNDNSAQTVKKKKSGWWRRLLMTDDED